MSARTEQAEESRPLLASQNHLHQCGEADTEESTGERLRLMQLLRNQWPILRIMVVALLWGMGSYGAAPSYLDGLRAYTCAYHYSTHPDLLPDHPRPHLPHDRDRPCAVKGVESKVGVLVAAATMLSFVLSSFSMLFYGPRLSKWGRKPMLIISLMSNIINYAPFVVLPLGYPFGDIPSELLVSPAAAMGLILLSSCLVGLTGFAGLFLCVLRVMIVDVAPPTRRTVTLNWLISATLLGGFFGPLLAAWALDTSVRPRTPHAPGSTAVLGWLTTLSLDTHPLPAIPGETRHHSKHGNPAALVACCWVFLLAILWSLVMMPETSPETAAARGEASTGRSLGQYADDQSRPDIVHAGDAMSTALFRTSKILGPLSLYLPQTATDGSKDYRLTWLALAGMFSNIGTNALQYIAIFAGYKFDFTPDAIGLLLGLIGATRAIWLIFAIPLVVVLLERNVKKPPEISELTKQQLEDLARIGLKSSTTGPVGSTSEAQNGRLQHFDSPVSLIRSVVLWRTAMDVAIGKLSYAADIVGYLVVFLSAGLSNAAAMIVGTLFLSFGAGAGPAVASAAIAIIQDMKQLQHPSLDASLHASPTDDWLAALSISDNIVNGFSPILLSLVYSLTIETAFPSVCFLIPTIGYLLSFALLSMVKTKP